MGKKLGFEIIRKSKKSKARIGIIHTASGDIETPVFLPVATKGVIKTLTNQEVLGIGFKALLMNTYHLYLKPGDRFIKKQGGLHKFLNWNYPIITDSGGFQVFSLGLGIEHNIGKYANWFADPEIKIQKQNPNKKLAKIYSWGVEFQSHLDGSWHKLTPQKSIEIQENLDSDLGFALDECTSPFSDYNYTKESLIRTHNWAIQSLKSKTRKDFLLFGVVQGGLWKDLRVESAKFISSLDFNGFGIGGPVGKDQREMLKIAQWVLEVLPQEKPKHMLGIGHPNDLEPLIKLGIDSFDCVAPARYARHGYAFYKNKKLNLNKSIYLNDLKPIDRDCNCYTCQNFSRQYLSYLFRISEFLAMRLLTIHNLFYMFKKIEEIKNKIRKDLI
ncbi:MAG TPA: tRNA guanosine(34) transglycosylase Tgt [Candidatus Paceibacterota bacterium]|nr:tRNA guanosine(34) transglycosylase Tgt [Candidatus Paceibacterota bacterium]